MKRATRSCAREKGTKPLRRRLKKAGSTSSAEGMKWRHVGLYIMQSEKDWQLKIMKNLFFLCVKVILTSILISCSSVCTVCLNLILHFYFSKGYNIRILTLFSCTVNFTFSNIPVTNLFNKTSTKTHGLKKCRLETLPALLDHITPRGADNIASCKLVEKLFRVHTPWEFINDLLRLCRRLWSLYATTILGPDFSCDFKVINIFDKMAIFSSCTLHEVTDV